MQIQTSQKHAIAAAIRADYDRRAQHEAKYSQTSHATYLGINTSTHSRLLRGETEKLLSDQEWARVAVKLGVELTASLVWKTATTSVFTHITIQLEHCQKYGTTGLFCDQAGIGKTHAAKQYARTHNNAVYIDCSQVKTKHQFVRALAREFGFDCKGRLMDVKAGLVEGLLALDCPLVILDEAGDLDYPAFLEIKALYNALEHCCGWYMLGAQGLEAKMERLRISQKVGYEELYDRFGARYQSVTDELDQPHVKALMRYQAEQVLKANLPNISKADADAILKDSQCNLRRLRKEVIKYKSQAA